MRPESVGLGVVLRPTQIEKKKTPFGTHGDFTSRRLASGRQAVGAPTITPRWDECGPQGCCLSDKRKGSRSGPPNPQKKMYRTCKSPLRVARGRDSCSEIINRAKRRQIECQGVVEVRWEQQNSAVVIYAGIVAKAPRGGQVEELVQRYRVPLLCEFYHLAHEISL